MAGALLGLFLGVFALAQSESLHRHFHADAGKPHHQCAVTMLQSGQVETPVCFVTPTPAPTITVLEVVAQTTFVPSADFSLPPSCGPPALLS